MAQPNFDANQFVSDFERAFNAKDLGGVFSKYYDPNVEYADPEGKMQRGVDSLREMAESWSDGFSDTKLEVVSAVQKGNEIALLQRCTARHTGDFEMSPGESVPPTNKKIQLEIAEFLKINEQGKVVSDIGIMDGARFMKQLGLLPETSRAEPTKKTVQR